METPDPLDFCLTLEWREVPDEVRARLMLHLIDLVGVAAGGAGTELARIIRNHAAAQFPGRHAQWFDGRGVSALGYALSAGMTIDALDGHDGHNPTKGHVGCGLIAATLALALETGADGPAFLGAMAAGYEAGSRLGEALHATAADYHTSGAWVAVAAALAGARLLGLDRGRAAHALGIAEYHGPRSPMMRCIDHPTMVKDGSGWGAMAGVSAALLARDGFTGAPAASFGVPGPIWSDLGQRWRMLEQYVKPWPVCRWAQAPVAAALELRAAHGLKAPDIAHVRVETFHESTRLAAHSPATTEEAQYSTSFPVAVALARGGIGAEDIDGPALADPEILRLSRATEMVEDADANAAFPGTRLARVRLRLRGGTEIESGWHQPPWDAENPPTRAEIKDKFITLAEPAMGGDWATDALSAIEALESDGPAPLARLLSLPRGTSRSGDQPPA